MSDQIDGASKTEPLAKADTVAFHDTKAEPAPPEPRPVPSQAKTLGRKRRLVIGALGVAVIAALLVLGVPLIEEMLNTVSTDDAYVNDHVTFVAPRVAGQIAQVFVDDNNRVHKGEIIAVLDKEPFQVIVAERQAAVDTAQADLQAAIASTRATEAQARSERWNLQQAVQNVDSQVALLHARVADIAKAKAALVFAQVQFDRARVLVAREDVPRSEYDKREADLKTASAQLAQSLADVYQRLTRNDSPIKHRVKSND